MEEIDLEDFSSEEIEQEVEEYAVQMSNNENDKEEKEELEYDPPSVNDAIRGLQIVREYLQSSGGASSMDMEYLSRLEKRTLKDKLASKNHLNQKKNLQFLHQALNCVPLYISISFKLILSQIIHFIFIQNKFCWSKSIPSILCTTSI